MTQAVTGLKITCVVLNTYMKEFLFMRSSSLAMQALNNSHLLNGYMLNDREFFGLLDLSYGLESSSSSLCPRELVLNISQNWSTEM